MRDKIIRIIWHKSMPIKETIDSQLAKTQGLYYITRIFGKKETSLYLGIATLTNTIKHRLEGHRDWWLPEYRGQIFVRIGQVVYPKGLDMDKEHEIIDHAESAMLFEPTHFKMFPENVSKRKSYTYSELYRIENIGDSFELKTIIRMHEHEDDKHIPKSKVVTGSLIERWRNDKNAVRTTGKPSGEKLEIRHVDSIDKALRSKE